MGQVAHRWLLRSRRERKPRQRGRQTVRRGRGVSELASTWGGL